MPTPIRPIKTADITKLNFITSMVIYGCVPPYWVIMDFAKEPTKDLLMLIFGLDVFDMAQAIFDPSRGRKRSSARRGRKRGRGRGFPDINDIIVKRALASAAVPGALTAVPGRRIFTVLNIAEGVAFFAAVVDGVLDIAYESYIGNFQINSDDCYNVSRLQRQTLGNFVCGGEGSGFGSIACHTVEFSQGFQSSPVSCASVTGAAWVSFQCSFSSLPDQPQRTTTIAIRNQTTGELQKGLPIFTQDGRWSESQVGIAARQGDSIAWGQTNSSGFLQGKNAQVTAFSDPLSLLT